MWHLTVLLSLILSLATSTPNPRSIRDLANDKQIGEDSRSNKNNTDNAAVNYNNSNNTGNRHDCVCVPYHRCQGLPIAEDGIEIIDTEFDPQKEASEFIRRAISNFWRCENRSDICCKPSKIARRKKAHGCGRHNPDGVGLQVRGGEKNLWERHDAKFGELPWMVAVLVKKPMEQNSSLLVETYECGGTLIHPQAVLTAASCVFGKNTEQLVIRAGRSNIDSENKAYPHQDRDVSEVIIHEKFNPDSIHNDFAIVILSSPFELAEHIDVVCLPRQYDRFYRKACLITVWGKDVAGKPVRFSPKLRRKPTAVRSHIMCPDKSEEKPLFYNLLIRSSFICPGFISKYDRDTCPNNGVTPVICRLVDDVDRYVQVGFANIGDGCEGFFGVGFASIGRIGVFGVYEEIVAARPWIDEKMTDHNLDTAWYTYQYSAEVDDRISHQIENINNESKIR